ncbi:MAG: SDR family NAD(P)-dependent oxidoreductase [Acidobacteriota bacterium]|nr:SDR family NAD(P)-dependent oxidoreductase [Acidobacteriota bacterium]
MAMFTGKTAIVTGASRGIGCAIALRLAKDGAKTVLCARDGAALEAGVKEIQAAGGTATSIALDLRLPESPAQLAEFAAKHFGGIDIVVNNAGATKRGAFLELTDEDWADGFALKFFGAVRLTRAAWPYLKAARGSVINISGAGGRTPGAEFAIGGSVNAAMQSFAKAMAEVGIAAGVQVNVINPGLVRTGRFQTRLETVAKEQGTDLATAERQMVAASKTTRVGEPEDIAALVAFIAGPEGRFLQGSMIDIDGGLTKTL